MLHHWMLRRLFAPRNIYISSCLKVVFTWVWLPPGGGHGGSCQNLPAGFLNRTVLVRLSDKRRDVDRQAWREYRTRLNLLRSVTASHV